MLTLGTNETWTVNRGGGCEPTSDHYHLTDKYDGNVAQYTGNRSPWSHEARTPGDLCPLFISGLDLPYFPAGASAICSILVAVCL